ncbi:MAG: hypothetical protein WA102_01930 [Candidatus Methanoperedens sp.]
MGTYEDVIAVTKNYYGFASELFVSRVLTAAGKTKDNFSKSDIPGFASKIHDVAGNSLTPEKKEQLKKDILKLG